MDYLVSHATYQNSANVQASQDLLQEKPNFFQSLQREFHRYALSYAMFLYVAEGILLLRLNSMCDSNSFTHVFYS